MAERDGRGVIILSAGFTLSTPFIGCWTCTRRNRARISSPVPVFYPSSRAPANCFLPLRSKIRYRLLVFLLSLSWDWMSTSRRHDPSLALSVDRQRGMLSHRGREPCRASHWLIARVQSMVARAAVPSRPASLMWPSGGTLSRPDLA